ncbi:MULTISPECIES: hypothetical protein [unclassified Microbacterium]|uniref:hypothetical protein n=1 Tax=unclassified Microbacterium TaxID=2609290 RepID=UPI003016D429
MPLSGSDVLYPVRGDWLKASRQKRGAVYVLNAGEINPPSGMPYPHPRRAGELRAVTRRDGVVIAAGIGLKDPSVAASVRFDPAMRDAAVVSWRDKGSRDAAGFGDVAPDWAFSLGSGPATWVERGARELIAVTLRFDRPYPGPGWMSAVRALAARLDARIVTVAQVARDAPCAVRLAEDLEGEYLVAPSTRHADLDAHVRAVYARSIAVVSDRAHALIMGATEGAYPIGSAADPQKIIRLLDAVGIGALTGHHDALSERVERLDEELPLLGQRIETAREDLSELTTRIRGVIAHGGS